MSNDLWLPGYERIPIAGTSAESYRGTPFKIVIHKMQGWLDGSLSSYRQNLGVPHLSIEYRDGKGRITRRKVQHFPLNKMSRALLNKPGGVETNADGAVQIEIAGMSEDAADIEPDELGFYGEVLADIIRAGIDVQLVAPPFKGANEAYGTNSSTRLSFSEWDDFNGVCGHQHVPENDHWDPGALDIDTVLNAARSSLGQTATPPKENTLSAAEVMQIVNHIENNSAVTRADYRNAITAATETLIGFTQAAADVTRAYLRDQILAAAPHLTPEQIEQIAAAMPVSDPQAVIDELHARLAD